MRRLAVRLSRRLLSSPLPCVLLFALAALALFRDAFVSGQVYYQDDTLTYYLPLARRIDSILDEGRLPLWTPYIFGGHPLFADSESAVLYPPNLLAWLLLDPVTASVATRILRFFLGSVFAFAYGRAIGLSRAAATLVGLVFAFGSFLVGQLHHKNLGDASIWLPAILWALESGFRSRGAQRVRYWLAAGLAFGLQLLTIHINPELMTLMMLAVYVGARVLFLQPRPLGLPPVFARVRSAVIALATVGAVGGGMAAVQLLPLYELSTFSFRGHQVAYNFATSFNLPAANLLTLLFPYFFRDPTNRAYWSPWFRWDTTFYVGITPLLLAVAALALAIGSIMRRARGGRAEPAVPIGWVAFFGAVALFGVALALADHLPWNLFALLWHLPLFSSTRVPSRYLFLSLFALAILAGYGLDGLTRALERRTDRGVFVLLAAIVGATAGFVGLGHTWVPSHRAIVEAALLGPYLGQPGRNLAIRTVADPFAALSASLDPASQWTSRTLVCLALALLLFVIWRVVRRAATLVRIGLVLLAAGDLLLFGRDFHPRLPVDVVMAFGPAAEFLAAHNGLHRVVTPYTVWETAPNRLVPLRVAEANGYSSLLPERHGAYMSAALRLDNPLLDLMGVRYYIARRRQIPRPLQEQAPVFVDDEVAIFERPTALPRALLVDAAAYAATPRDALQTMLVGGFDPRRRAVVEDRGALDGLGGDSGVPAGSVDVASYSSERVVLRASAARPGLVILTDTYYPGWRAFVDDRPAPIYRADYLFRAVPVSAGDHTVRFAFDPPSVKIGALISTATLLTVGLALAVTAGATRRWSWRRLSVEEDPTAVQSAGV